MGTNQEKVAKAKLERSNYKQFAEQHKLNPDWLNQKFTHLNGDEYIIVGLNLRAQIYKVQTIRVKDNRPCKFAPYIIRAYFNNQ